MDTPKKKKSLLKFLQVLMNFLASLLFHTQKAGHLDINFSGLPLIKTRGKQWKVNFNFFNTYFKQNSCSPKLLKISFKYSFHSFHFIPIPLQTAKKICKMVDKQLNQKVFLKKLSTSYKNLISSAWEWRPADTSGSRKSAHSVKLTKL